MIQAAVVAGVLTFAGVVISSRCGGPSQSQVDSPGALQAGRDININSPTSPPDPWKKNDPDVADPRWTQGATGALIPAAEPDPKHSCENIPPNALKVLLGNEVAWIADRRDTVLVQVGGESLLPLKRSGLGALISARVLSNRGDELVRIEDNSFKVNADGKFKIDRPDAHELTVLSAEGRRLVQVRLINERSLRVAGEFQAPGFAPVVITSDKVMINGVAAPPACLGDSGVSLASFMR